MKVKEAIQRLAGFNLEADLILNKSEKVLCFLKDEGYYENETRNVSIITIKTKEEKPKPLVSKWYWTYWNNNYNCYTATGKPFSEEEIKDHLRKVNGSLPERIYSSCSLREKEENEN